MTGPILKRVGVLTTLAGRGGLLVALNGRSPAICHGITGSQCLAALMWRSVGRETARRWIAGSPEPVRFTAKAFGNTERTGAGRRFFPSPGLKPVPTDPDRQKRWRMRFNESNRAWIETIMISRRESVPEPVRARVIDTAERGIRRTLHSWPYNKKLFFRETRFSGEQEDSVEFCWYWEDCHE